MVGKKDKYLAAAQKFIERGQLDKALIEFAKVVQEDPKDTRTWLKMAELHAKRGANAEATEIYLRTGEMYTEQGFAQKAVAVYKNVLKLSPGTVSAQLKLGVLFKQLGLTSDAVQQFEQAAVALARGDKFPEAVAALRQAIEIQPDSVVLRVKLAESASQAGLTDEAVREFGRAAEQLKAQGRTDEALRVVERLLFHQPKNFAKARELAEAYIAKGSPRQALPKLQACLNADARDPLTLSLLARALEQLGQVPKAVSVLKELVRLYEELGRTNERDAAVLRGLTLDPSDPELRIAASRNQLRTATGAAADEATPPPGTVPAPDQPAGQPAFDLSGVVRAPAGGGSGWNAARGGGGSGGGDPGERNAAGRGASDTGPDVNRTLAEADVFVKYGLLERAADHLVRVFDFDPESRDARERLVSVLQRLGRKQDAALHLATLARQVSRTGPDDARRLAEKALLLDADCEAARALLMVLPPPGGNPPLEVATESGPQGQIEGTMGDPAAESPTPPPLTLLPRSGPSVDFDEDAHTDSMMVDVFIDVTSDRHEVGVDDEMVADDLASPTPPPLEAGAAAIGGSLPGEASETTTQDTLPRDLDAPALDEHGASFEDAEPVTVAAAAGTESLAAVMAELDDEDLSADLEQVTFFADQSLPEEAHALLQDLHTRFPAHPRVVGKLRELKLQDPQPVSGSAGPAPLKTPTPVVPPRSPAARTVIEGPSGERTPAPRAFVAGGDSVDSSTHADLAVAYKEMGLFDAAIGELKLLAQATDREVFALTTMGECFEAKGTFTEAVIRYKRALNCEQITREETLVLYYLLGAAFERLGDINEALYFFEKVTKRDPNFRDAVQRVAVLKPRMAKRAR